MERVLEREWPARATPTGPRRHDDDAVVGHDLDPGGDEVVEELPAAHVHLAADRVDLQPDLDALAHLGRQRLEERLVPMSPGL